ncbi:hypothetical protein HG530_011811 [Fusarium avenaceum]|nr:hypothetical protein HG530_011811 [Fusarium avenaceum]
MLKMLSNSAGTASAPAPVLAIFSFKWGTEVSIQFSASRAEGKTHQLLHLLLREAGNVVHGAIRKAKHVGLDAGFAFSAIGLLCGARLVIGALAADERVATSGAVAARRVRHANVGVTV